MERKLIDLYRQLYDEGAFFFERVLPVSFENKKSAVIQLGGDFAVFMDAARVETIAEETELVAHECGHVATGTTHGVCSPLDLVERHERRANKWAVHRILPPEEIRRVMKAGYTDLWEIAEQTGRTEGFVRLAFDVYRAEGVEFSAGLADELFPVRLACGM